MEDADATRSRAPEVSSPELPPVVIVEGDLFVDEPEQYAVKSQIGMGGMGTVLAAKGSRFGRSVALKVVTADRDDLRRRFEREATVTARLQHPAIVPVYGSGRRDGKPFYAMKHVTGEPLDQAIAKAATQADRIGLVPKVIAVTEAIAYAHSEKVIHRDLKPANILVGAFGETVVIDWGLAKDLDRPDDVAESTSPYRASAADATAHGKVMGTPAYMPLEQARGESVDERADVYALGAILYHVLAGAPPYRKPDEGSVPWESMLARVIAGPPEPLDAVAPGLPPDLLAIVARAMARDAAARYASAQGLAEDLRRFQTGQLVGAHRYTTWQLVKRWLRRHRTAVIVAGVALTMLIVVGGVLLKRIFDEQRRTQEQSELAQAKRAEADKNRGAAEDLLGFMLVDLRNKLKPLGKLDLLDAVAKKATDYYGAQPELGTNDELRKRSQAVENLGDVLVGRGKTTDALAQFRAALALRDRIAPPGWEGETASLRRKLGDVLAKQGDSAGALAEYRASLGIDERIGELGGAAAAHERIGDIATGTGDLPGALKEYRVAATVEDDDATKHPDVWLARQGRAVAHKKIGSALIKTGDITGALVELRLAASINDADLGAEPDNAERRSDFESTHQLLGDALEETGDVKGSQSEYERVLEVTNRAIAIDPSNLVERGGEAMVQVRLARALYQQSRNADAIAAYRAADDSRVSLTAQDPKNTTWQNLRLVEKALLGEVLRTTKDDASALKVLREAVVIAEHLVAADPTNGDWQYALATAHERVFDELEATGDLREADVESRKVRDVESALVAKFPANFTWQRASSVSIEARARILDREGDAAGAAAAYREVIASHTKLIAQFPTRAVLQGDLRQIERDFGLSLIAHHDPAAAIEQFHAALELTAKVDTDPADVAKRDLTASIHEGLGDALHAHGDAAAATAEYQAARTIWEGLLARQPESAELRERVQRIRGKP